MSAEETSAPEAPSWLVGRELSPGELKEAIAYLKHKAERGKVVRDENGKVDPVALATQIRARMPY